MKKKLLLKLSVIVAVALILGGSLVPSIGIVASLSPSDAVNEAEAEQAALDRIEKSSQEIVAWNNATVSKPVIYYAPDMTRSAYEFTVQNDDQNIGFIIVSARKDWMPILEYGSGSAPSSYLPNAKQMAVEQLYITT